jgi:hypothetical protein
MEAAIFFGIVCLMGLLEMYHQCREDKNCWGQFGVPCTIALGGFVAVAIGRGLYAWS